MSDSSPSILDGPIHDVAPDLIAWRRRLHEYPEVSFEERETARFVIAQLDGLGIECEQPTPTSVIAEIEGGVAGPTLAARADLDALPIQETSDLTFASRNPGVMHACGHDGHTATLLGLASVLTKVRSQLPGRVRLIFQHAEEVPGGGAQELIDAGVLDSVKAIVGVHLWAPLPLGTVGLVSGAAMASTDYFEVEFVGTGGHVGAPHESADPVAASADLIQATQRLVSKELGPLAQAVAAVTRVRSGEALNVIPAEASVGGTLRALDAGVRRDLISSIERAVEQVAASHGVTHRVSLTAGPPPLRNDPRIVEVFTKAAEVCPAVDAVQTVAPLLAGDDFACYLERVPGAYAFVGAGRPGVGGPHPHHHPSFVIEERGMEIATELLARTILTLARGPVSK